MGKSVAVTDSHVPNIMGAHAPNITGADEALPVIIHNSGLYAYYLYVLTTHSLLYAAAPLS